MKACGSWLGCAIGRQQLQFPCALHRRGPVTDLELGVDAADVRADGVRRDGQLARDLKPGQIRREIPQHPQLARAELFRVRWGGLLLGRRGRAAQDVEDVGEVPAPGPAVAFRCPARKGMMKQARQAGPAEPRQADAGAPQGLELRHLRYFVALADAGSFTLAAERMFIAQPTLSQQIWRLEEIIGTQLMQRRREGLRLTTAGAVMLEASARCCR
jgi:hypothetical protein